MNGTYFEKEIGECIKCKDSMVYNLEKKVCECGKDNFWDGYKCLECFYPMYLD
jgi:hypothetical protein